MQESLLFGELTMTMLRMPLWIPQAILPIGGFLLSVRLLQRLVFLLKNTPEEASDATIEPETGYL